MLNPNHEAIWRLRSNGPDYHSRAPVLGEVLEETIRRHRVCETLPCPLKRLGEVVTKGCLHRIRCSKAQRLKVSKAHMMWGGNTRDAWEMLEVHFIFSPLLALIG